MRRWAAILAVLAACGEAREPATAPAGRDERAGTAVLEAGAKVLQSNAPVAGMDVYVVGFHPMKDDPEHQMEAHHFCRQVNEDLMQCALFDGNTADANLTGLEYIISERLFEQLPPDERPYWHPHNGEILSGQLVAPGLPAAAEQALMRTKMNSYGKTWHTWASDRGATLPLGPPMLAWSFNRDGEAQPEMVARRDRALDVDTARVRERRAELRALAKPQEGVDALKGRFARPTTDIPGVVDKAARP
jgi:hypothetical protein